MRYILDTDILIDLEKAKKEMLITINKLTGTLELADYNITFINLFEFLLGVKIKSHENQAKAKSFVEKFGVLNTSDRTASVLADLKTKYDRRVEVMSLADLIIASLAIENDMFLISRDSDFEEIEELKKIII